LGHTLTSVSSSSAVVFGGFDGVSLSNGMLKATDNVKYFKELSLVGDYISPRKGHSTIFFQEELYIFGGMGYRDVVLNDLFCVTFSKLIYSSKKIFIRGPSPYIAFGTSLFYFFQDSFFVHGGFNGKEHSKDSYSFNLKESRWSKVQLDKSVEFNAEKSFSTIFKGSLIIFDSSILIITLNSIIQDWSVCQKKML
jgi:hypothetical protein